MPFSEWAHFTAAKDCNTCHHTRETGAPSAPLSRSLRRAPQRPLTALPKSPQPDASPPRPHDARRATEGAPARGHRSPAAPPRAGPGSGQGAAGSSLLTETTGTHLARPAPAAGSFKANTSAAHRRIKCLRGIHTVSPSHTGRERCGSGASVTYLGGKRKQNNKEKGFASEKFDH